ncbi:MAG: type 4a pilus biogenesis protein PilO [Nitrospirota bacterium]|nr:type 4a pilus biogenesis protein PilO [Nitrospirota bacterium]
MNRRKYILLAAALVMTLLLFQTYVLTPKSETMREEIQVKSATLQKYETYLEGSSITDTEIRTAGEEMKAVEKKLVKESSEFLAAAHMQKELSELTQNAGLNIQNIRPLNTVKAKTFFVIPVYFEGSGTIKQIGDFLNNVEKHSVLLKIEKLSINVTNMQNPRELRFKMQISGLGKS